MKLIIIGGVAGGASCTARLRRLDDEAELCYAPKFGSGKDRVNCAGMVAADFIRGDMPVFIGINLKKHLSLMCMNRLGLLRTVRMEQPIPHWGNFENDWTNCLQIGRFMWFAA